MRNSNRFQGRGRVFQVWNYGSRQLEKRRDYSLRRKVSSPLQVCIVLALGLVFTAPYFYYMKVYQLATDDGDEEEVSRCGESWEGTPRKIYGAFVSDLLRRPKCAPSLKEKPFRSPLPNSSSPSAPSSSATRKWRTMLKPMHFASSPCDGSLGKAR